MGQSVTSIQCSLVAGELSPSLYGRVDIDKYHSGTSTCRNFYVNYRGGVSSRAGLAYVGMCKQQYPVPPRDIPFQFSLNQGFVLEFGEFYLRIKSDGAYVIETSKSSSVNSSAVFTVTTHGYSVGDWIYDLDNEGFSGLTWIVATVPTGNTFTVTDLFGNIVTSATASSGGSVARIYTSISPYAAVDLPYLKYSQSADVMTLTCVNTETETEYPPYSLIRQGNANWGFLINTFSADITAPTGVVAVARSSSILSTWYSYVVTAVSSDTGEESVASSIASVQNNDIAINAGSNTLTWNAVTGASSYNIYLAPASYQVGVPVSSVFGYIGTALGPAFTDDNITPDFTKVPPVHNNPFARGAVFEVTPTAAGINYDQSTIGYSVTTSTGTDFSGRPVVASGGLIGFIVDNQGRGYVDSDTIAFTDSGGGVATGNYTVTLNATDGAHFTMNGIQLTFRRSSAAPGFNEVPLGNTIALTLQSLSNFLNSSTDIDFSCAIYTYDATHLYIKYKTPGTVGNAYTLGTTPDVPAGWTRSAATLTGGGTVGSGATANLVIGPESGTYPAVTNYFSQRRVYANSLNEPDTYWMSQPGLFNNMDSSIPVTDSDAIVGTPWAQQVNGIQWLVPMPGGLIVFTGKGAWQVNGGQQSAITPSNQNAVAQAFVKGCNGLVQPLPVNQHILYVQTQGYVLRDIEYNFYNNIYTGIDLTVFSNHLFFGKQVIQMAWAEEPFKLIWIVLDDGQMLCLTYLRDQEIYSWSRHDTNGLFKSVVSIVEPPVDAVYVIVQRYVEGAWRYYSERMNNRLWENVEDSFCVDSGLTSTLTYPDATLVASAATGMVLFTASSPVFTTDNVNDVIRMGGGKAIVTQWLTTTTVFGLIEDQNKITTLVPDDPDETPVPAVSGNWSISTPFTTVSGLNHLEGLEVTILADGSVVPNQVVTNGSITLQYEASLATVGLPYTCQLQTMYLDHPDQGNTIQNRRKNISSVGIRLEASRGMTLGADQIDQSTQQNNASPPWTGMQEIKERTAFSYAGNAVPLYTGDYYKNITAGWSVKSQIAVEQSFPLPVNVLALVAYWELGDEQGRD